MSYTPLEQFKFVTWFIEEATRILEKKIVGMACESSGKKFTF